jgi:hypothetical protein
MEIQDNCKIVKHRLWDNLENPNDWSPIKKADINHEEVGEGIAKCLCNKPFSIEDKINLYYIQNNNNKIVKPLTKGCFDIFLSKREEDVIKDYPQLAEYKGKHKSKLLKEIQTKFNNIYKNPNIDDNSLLIDIKYEHYRLCTLYVKLIVIIDEIDKISRFINDDDNKYNQKIYKLQKYQLKYTNRKNLIGYTFKNLYENKNNTWEGIVEYYKDAYSYQDWAKEIKMYRDYLDLMKKSPEYYKLKLEEITKVKNNIRNNYIDINNIDNIKTNFEIMY